MAELALVADVVLLPSTYGHWHAALVHLHATLRAHHRPLLLVFDHLTFFHGQYRTAVETLSAERLPPFEIYRFLDLRQFSGRIALIWLSIMWDHTELI